MKPARIRMQDPTTGKIFGPMFWYYHRIKNEITRPQSFMQDEKVKIVRRLYLSIEDSPRDRLEFWMTTMLPGFQNE
jgi:hypothetical protein